MLFIVVILLSVLSFQTIQTSVSPATLRAMATLQNHRARAIANAVRAQALYNAARARTNLGLLDHRVIRNLDDQLGDAPDTDFEGSNIGADFGDAILRNMGYNEEGLVLNRDPNERSDGQFLNSENFQSNVEGNLGQSLPCSNNMLGENFDPTPSNVQLHDFNELEQFNSGSCATTVNHEQSKHCQHPGLPCQRPDPNPTRPTHDSSESGGQNLDEPTLGMQPGLPYNQPSFGQPILVPMQYIQGVPTYPYVPQGNPYANFPLQQFPTLPSGYGPQMVFLRASSEIDEKNGHFPSQTPSHAHKKPHESVQESTGTPGQNLRVVEHQSSSVGPQQIPSTILKPRSNSPGQKFTQINPDGSIYSPVGTGYATVFPPGNGQIFIGQGLNNGHFQDVLTSQPVNNQYFGPLVGSELEDMSRNAELSNTKVNPEDVNEEKVGAFKNLRMEAPESPDHFDPNRPRDLLPVMNYIERHSPNMKRMMEAIEHNENLAHHSASSGNFHIDSDFVRSPRDQENVELEDADSELLGTFPLEEFHINPAPTLPENFLEMDSEEKRESIQNYLNEEQSNVEDFLDQVDKNNRRNLDRLSSLINPVVLPHQDLAKHSEENHAEEEENPNDFQTEIIGNPNGNLDEQEIEDMLATFLENDPEDNKEIDVISDSGTSLGHIIDIPSNNWYPRHGRSANHTSFKQLDKLLLAEKAIINELKKDAKHDEDLMMIGYIGENIIQDLEKRRNETKRSKREIPGGFYSSPFNRLLMDPQTKLDVPKTLNNLGVVTKNTFEHENAPLYHVRNMVGSAQDAVMATMKIPNRNFLIPSQYEIVNRDNDNRLLGDINPSLYQNNVAMDDFSNTFQKVGTAIRGGVQSGQEALSHVGQAANHAKNAIHSTRYTTPKLVLTQDPTTSRESITKAMLITPRIFDITSEDQQVGNMLDNPQGGFVNLGNIFDAVGVSDPNTNNVQFQKIVMEPKHSVSVFETSNIKPSELFKNILGRIRVVDLANEEKEDQNVLGNTLSNLENVRETFGVGNLRDFFTRMKQDLKQVANSIEKHNPTLTGNTESSSNNANVMRDNTQSVQQNQESQDQGLASNKVDQNQEIVRASMIPDSLIQPFMGQLSQDDRDRFWKEQNEETNKQKQGNSPNSGLIVGAINPMMFERLFDETLKARDESTTPFTVFNRNQYREGEGDDNKVGTNMKLNEGLKKPFMGRASDKVKHDFYHKYESDSGEENYSGAQEPQVIEMPIWMEDTDRGKEIGYDD